MPIFRRLSTRFGPRKEGRRSENSSSLDRVEEPNGVQEHKQTPSKHTNGVHAVNGTSIGNSLEKTKIVDKRHPSYSAPPREAPAPVNHDEQNKHTTTRKDVESAFEQFAQLLHASRRPLPSQSGDGSYLTQDQPTGFWSDLTHMGFKDVERNVETVKHIMEDKASGKPQDDRKMHMEEIMQVSAHSSPSHLTLRLA